MPPQIPRAGLSPGDYADWHQQATSFSEMGAYGDTSTGFNLTGDGEPQRVLVGYASSDKGTVTHHQDNNVLQIVQARSH
jgi:hypothetical protein